MYSRDFTDPDGHVWGMFWMDLSAVQGETESDHADNSNQKGE